MRRPHVYVVARIIVYLGIQIDFLKAPISSRFRIPGSVGDFVDMTVAAQSRDLVSPRSAHMPSIPRSHMPGTRDRSKTGRAHVVRVCTTSQTLRAVADSLTARHSVRLDCHLEHAIALVGKEVISGGDVVELVVVRN